MADGAATSTQPRASLALVGGWLLFFLPQVLSSGVPYYRDNLQTLLPIRAYLHERLRSGELPQWFPYEGLGEPFIGQVVGGTFHPQTLLFLALPAILAIKWNLLFAYLLACIGAYRFARRVGASRAGAVVAGWTFGLGGPALGVSHNLVYAMSFATLPWVADGALRLARSGAWRHVPVVAAPWALLLLGGDAQAFLVAPLFLLAAVPSAQRPRRMLLQLGVAGGLTAGLVAPELFPAMLVSEESLRRVGDPSPTIGLTWALHPLRLVELFCRGFVPDPVRNRFVADVLAGRQALWSTTIYAGALTLVLAGFGLARRHAVWAGLAALGLLLSLGDRGGLLPVLSSVLDVFGRFRYPEKYLLVVACAGVPLVGAGVDAILASRLGVKVLGAGAVTFVVLSAGSITGWLPDRIWALAGKSFGDWGAAGDTIRSAWATGFVTSAIVLGLSAAVVAMQARLRHAAALLAAIALVDAIVANQAHFPLIPRSALEEAHGLVATLHDGGADTPSGPRVVRLASPDVESTVTSGTGEAWVRAMRTSLWPTTPSLEHFSALGMNLPGTLARYALAVGSGARPARYSGGLFTTVPNALPPGLTPISREEGSGVVLAEAPFAPRFAFTRWVTVPDRGAAMAAVEASSDWETSFVEGGPALERATGTIDLASWAPERVVLEVTAATQAGLVLRDQFARGWEATVDGLPTPIFAVDVAVRGVVVPEGRHVVLFQYRTPGLTIGLVSGMLAVLFALSIVVAGMRRAGRY